MKGGRLLAPAAWLALAGSALAQGTAQPVADVAAWTARFMAVVAGPNTAAAACAPAINGAIGRMRDPASARVALAEVRPCGQRIRAAYADAERALAALPPLTRATEAAVGVDTHALLAGQRSAATAAVAYVGDVDRFLEAVVAGDRAALPALHARMRTGGAAVIDGTIVQMRAQQAASRLEQPRQLIELRIVMTEAARALMTALPDPAGVAVGPEMTRLAARAQAAVAASRAGWARDRARLTALAPGDARLAGMLDAGGTLSDALTDQGTRMAALLAAAGRQPALSQAAATRLATDLNAVEAEMLRQGQAFATNLQTIG